MTQPESTPTHPREIVRNAAGAALFALGQRGVVSRAVIVVELVDDEGAHLSTLSSTDLPWEAAGLLEYGKHQLLREDDRGANE